MAIMDELMPLERRFWTDGADFYRDNVDGTCLVAFTSMAAVMTSEELAASVENGPRWHELQIEVKGVVQPQPGLAILTYEAAAKRADDGRYAALVSSGYARRAQGWKLIFHQQTPLGG